VGLLIEVKMTRNITPQNCTSIHTIKYIINNSFSKIYPNMITPLDTAINNSLSEIYPHMITPLDIAINRHCSAMVLKTETYKKTTLNS
jgi:hypothetical protein